MGRLDRQKGFDLLLSAWGRIASDAPEWNLIILGDGPERPALEAQASSLPRVALPGKVHQPAPLLNAAGIFVMSSRFEGFPNALLEAMAVGLPVISTDCPSGPGDIIQSGVNGLLVPVESVDGLEKAMKSLIADESLRRRLSSQAPGSLAWLAPERILPLWEACLEGQPNPQVCSS
jgi:glycosyltransferase involved in cell wall biosynthesis